MIQGIYLDNSMAARPSDRAVSQMLPFLTDMWGSPSSPHLKGQELFPAITESYKAIYALLGAKESDDFILTSCGAEGINQVILSCFYNVTRISGKNQLVTSHIDEAPAIMAMGRLETMGCVCKMAEAAPSGMITAQAIADTITPRTALISLSWANALTGVINPVAEIARICKERGILFHLDATHVLGKLFFDLEEVGADYITFNGDQLHAPKGTGGLYIKAGVKCAPLILGGSEQAGYRGGSLNVPGLVALGAAAQEALESRDFVCTEIARLRDKLENGVVEAYPEASTYFQEQDRLPNCTILTFPGIANEALLYALNRKKVFASIGGGSLQQAGLILKACGINETLAQTALSFSLSRETTEEEIDNAIEIIADAAKRLSKLRISESN